MIPYFEWHIINLGLVAIQVWGLFVAFGFIAGVMLARYRFLLYEKKNDWIWDLGAWIIIGALAGARIGHVIFYEWQYFSRHLAEVINVWDGGMSSFGGFIGAAVAFVIFARTHKARIWRTVEVILWAFPFGMIIGRIGCFFAHDHPGVLTSSFLAVQYPGGARFDLGLLEIVALLPLATFFALLYKKQFKQPVFTIIALIYYGLMRFVLDFLRIANMPGADARYFGLTPAQYGSIILIALAVWIWKGRIVV